ncbi:helix-turn-helix transcriptional regulator [Saccharopolyspora sp. HNM0986]|uniref:helix-turn-helix transcriptional regulator n=1 Tax=Saccharopolyspora galaxeae TaxID=2781241 RepID=UPI0019095BA6|nr:helix-turn-helix transcriptional regulator [Saccharopolyspora sp. HNM0986]MBK0867763.1 helix-turn-helix transcriptional regulator [Saccharopolyspora sp. HNM0986]
MTQRCKLALANSPLVTGALRQLTTATGLPVVFGGPVGGDRALLIDQLGGTRTRSLQHLRVDTGAGLGGKAVALERPSTVVDYLHARGITHKYDRAVEPEQLRAMLAIPVRVDAATRAVLYAATREQTLLGDRTLRAAAGVAARLERDIEVEEEVRRRVAAPQQVAGSGRGTAARQVPGDSDDLHAELLDIAGRTSDEDSRNRLLELCDRWRGQHAEPGVELTPREVDVLRCVADGHTNDEAAAHLELLPNTVKSYLKHAMRKLGVTNRIQAVNRARSAGLL